MFAVGDATLPEWNLMSALDRSTLRRCPTTPLTAITELIWNALDADATNVRVALVENELQGVVEIRVEDDGHGMTHERAVEGFQSLGGSWKRLARSSPGGRVLHGREGRGRFRAADWIARAVAHRRSRPSRCLAEPGFRCRDASLRPLPRGDHRPQADD